MRELDDVADDEEINRQWEDAIGFDDSDLLHLLSSPPPPRTLKLTAGSLSTLRPCSQAPCPSQLLASDFQVEEEEEEEAEQIEAEAERRREGVASGRRIPGPAGAIQAAMHRRSATDVRRGGSCLEEQRWGERSLAVDDEDGDFELNPWLRAVEFLGKDFGLGSPISSIKSRTGDRVSQVVGIIKSCTPNGLGDFLLTLKDPTGCIGATVHHRALLEHNLSGNVSVGCVLVLKQVVVFCPARSVQYLNVTSSNVVKLIRNDCGPPNKQNLTLLSARCVNSEKRMKASHGTKEQNFMQNGSGSPIEEEHIQNAVPESYLIAPHVTGRIADKPGSEDTGSGLLVDAESSMMNGLAVGRSLNNQRMTSRLEMTVDRDFSFNTTVSDTPRSKEIRHLPRKDMDITPNVAVDPSQSNAGIRCDEIQKISNHESARGNKDRFAGPPPDLHVDHNVASIVMHTKSDFRSHGAENVISKVSVAQWTDEQLMELFADYHDADLFQPQI